MGNPAGKVALKRSKMSKFALQFSEMVKLVNFLMVGLGGAAGSMLRYVVTMLGSALGISGNTATFFANTLGSFLIGLLTGCCRQETLLLLLTVGLCGGFTTFSTFSMQSVTLLERGRYGMAAVYIAGTLLLCLLCCWVGYRLGTKKIFL